MLNNCRAISCKILVWILSGIYFVYPFHPTDFKPVFQGSENENETWSYMVSFQNESFLFLELSIVNRDFENSTTANVVFVNFNGKNHQVSCKYPAKKYFNFSHTDSSYMLKFHRVINITGQKDKQQVKFFREKNGIKYIVNLKFDSMIYGPSFRDKKGNYLEIFSPHSTVQGIMAIDQDTLKVKGVGYLDKLALKNLPTNLYASGVRYFKLTPPLNSGCIMRYNKKNKGELLGGGVFQNESGLLIQQPDKWFDKQSMVKFKNGKSLKFNIIKQLDKRSIFDEVPGGMGGIVKIFSKDLIYIREVGTSQTYEIYLITRFIFD